MLGARYSRSYLIPPHSKTLAIHRAERGYTYTRHSTPIAARKQDPEAAVLFGKMPKSIIDEDVLGTYFGHITYAHAPSGSWKRVDNEVFEHLCNVLVGEKLPKTLEFRPHPSFGDTPLDLHGKRITPMQVLVMCASETWRIKDVDGRNKNVLEFISEVLKGDCKK